MVRELLFMKERKILEHILSIHNQAILRYSKVTIRLTTILVTIRIAGWKVWDMNNPDNYIDHVVEIVLAPWLELHIARAPSILLL